MGATATGADARFGLVIDEPTSTTSSSPDYNVGHPGFDTVAVAAPVAALTAADGGAGNITGSVYYWYSYVVNGMETTPSATSTVLTVTSKKAALSDILVCPDTRCTERRIYRYTADTVAVGYWVGSIYDNTTTTFTDDLSLTSTSIDATLVPKTVNETSGNFGMKFCRFDNLTLKADYSQINPVELTGASGKSKSVPGMVNVDGQLVAALRSGTAVPLFCALYGTPSVAQSDSVYTYTWAVSTSKATWRTLTGYLYHGAFGVKPQTYYGLAAPSLALNIQGGALVTDTATFVGQAHTTSGVATESVGGTTYKGTLCARGIRGDASSTTNLYVKVTTAPTTGTFAVKFKVGSGASYSGSAFTMYYDTTTKKQEKGGSQTSDWAPAYSEADLTLGYDIGENFLPYEIMFSGDITTLALNDEFIIPPTALIVGGTGSGYTAVPPHVLLGPRFTDAHATITKDGTTIDCQSLALTLNAPKERIYSLGSDARWCIDMADNGYYEATGSIVQRMTDRTYEQILETADRFALVVKCEGERIKTQPGTLSASRETVQITFPQAAVTSVDAPISGPGMISKTINFATEAPDDGSEYCTVVVKTKEKWQLLA